MKWLSRRVNIAPEIWGIMEKLKIRKADFIRMAINEKLDRDFKIKQKIPF